MNKFGKPVTQRQLRVGEMIKQALGMLFIRDEAKLPNLSTKEITVTEVRMSQDLKTAKIFVKIQVFLFETVKETTEKLTQPTKSSSGIDIVGWNQR